MQHSDPLLQILILLAASVCVGGAVAMSSTAIIIAQLTEQSENNRTHGRLAVAICLFQDLSFPLLLGLVSALAGGGRSAAGPAHRRRHRIRRIGAAAGSRRGPVAAASTIPGHRLGPVRRIVFARGIVLCAGRGLGD